MCCVDEVEDAGALCSFQKRGTQCSGSQGGIWVWVRLTINDLFAICSLIDWLQRGTWEVESVSRCPFSFAYGPVFVLHSFILTEYAPCESIHLANANCDTCACHRGHSSAVLCAAWNPRMIRAPDGSLQMLWALGSCEPKVHATAPGSVDSLQRF